MRFNVLFCVVVVAALSMVPNVVAADPSPAAENEQWGPEVDGLRTRLVPLEKKYVLGQPMRFRLELRNFGRDKARYSSQQVTVNRSLEVRNQEGKSAWFIGHMCSTMAEGPAPSLAPGATVVLFDGYDLILQYLIVKPGKYTVQFHSSWLPDSNATVIDVQPGPLPPVVRVVVRLRDILPKGWKLSVDTSVLSWSRKFSHRGWKGKGGMFSVKLTGPVTMHMKVVEHKMVWTGKVDYPGERTIPYLGQCPEGHVYGNLPTSYEAQAAKWPTLREDIEKALQIVPKKYYPPDPGVKDDNDLKHVEDLTKRDSLHLVNAKITDAGLKHLEGLTELKELWLSGAQITDAGLKHLKGIPQLERLSLDNTQITDAGLEHLKGLSQLESLSLDGTKITGTGLKHLKGLPRLSVLSLDGARITDAGLEHLKGLTNLSWMYLRNTKITGDGLKYLAGLTKLQGLRLNGAEITDAGMKNLRGLIRLERLYLANTKITDAGLEHLQGLTQLERLSLEETRVTDDGARKLQQALPNCEIVYGPRSERY